MLVYLVFVAGILFFVYKSSRQNEDLVTQDYYGEEIQYQKKIDQTARTNALSDTIVLKMLDGNLVIHFPSEFNKKKIAGDILLYCPSDENKDLRENFSTNDPVYAMKLPVSNKGLYRLKLNWVVDGVTYYYEKKLTL